MMKTLKNFLPVFLLIQCLFMGCEKMIEIDPPIERISAQDVYENRSAAILAITGLYAQMATFSDFSGETAYSIQGATLSDEMNMGPDAWSLIGSYRNDMMLSEIADTWINLYSNYIFKVNSIIEGIGGSKTIDQKTKNIILGEAMFLRAFYYFYLVNTYGGVPLVTTTDYKINGTIARSSENDVYAQIIKDLKNAQGLLTDNYLGNDLNSSTPERVRPNRMAATALLARVYLYTRDWTNAEIESGKVISNLNYELIEDLNGVFLKNSKETIWQLQPNPKDFDGENTYDGRFMIPRFDGTVPNLFASTSLKSAFEPGDLRKANWLKDLEIGGVTYSIPYKYKKGYDSGPSAEYVMVLRLSEQYLIRAEARAQLGKLTGTGSGQSDLDAVRRRAGLGNTIASGKDEFLVAILKERQTELFTEWGNRWFDLKRTGKIDEVMSHVAPTKTFLGIAGTWAPYKALFPIPSSEFLKNTALKGHQNPGYSEN